MLKLKSTAVQVQFQPGASAECLYTALLSLTIL